MYSLTDLANFIPAIVAGLAANGIAGLPASDCPWKMNSKKNYMKRIGILVIVALILAVACKQKAKPDPNAPKFISVNSIIEKQIAHIDTSLYNIIKVTGLDSLHYDTEFVHRENFRKLATDFLSIPDLSDPENAVLYKEETNYDTLLRRIFITYTALNPAEVEVYKQQLLISQDVDSEGNNKVMTILINKSRKNRDGAFTQNLLWQMDRSFLVTTTTQAPGAPEVTTVTRVIWNDEKFR